MQLAGGFHLILSACSWSVRVYLCVRADIVIRLLPVHALAAPFFMFFMGNTATQRRPLAAPPVLPHVRPVSLPPYPARLQLLRLLPLLLLLCR